MNSSAGLRTRLKTRFEKQINDIVMKHDLREVVLVLDISTAFILSTVFKLTELVALKVNYIERLEVVRKKLNKHAIYFIEPSHQNVACLIKDFQDEEPQYRRIHILFTSFADKSILQSMATHKPLLKKIAKNSIKQFYCSCRIMAQNLVDMNIPYLQYAYGKESESEQIRRINISRKMIEYISNVEEVNTVRIFYKKSSNYVCQRMAETLQKTVKEYLGILLINKSVNVVRQAKDITFLLLDRSIDTVTPVLHYFTYEAMLFDLFDVRMVEKSKQEEKGVFSYEEIQNEVYEAFRYKHISQALQKLPEALEREKDKLDSLKSANTKQISIQNLTDRITDIKQNLENLSMIWNTFKANKLDELAELEFSLATGLSGAGENTSSAKLVQQVCELAKNQQNSKELRLRFALLALSCIKLSQKDYSSILQLFSQEDKRVLKNLLALGVTYDSSVSKSTKTVTKNQQDIAKQRMKKTKMPLDRYSSIIELVVPLFSGILSNQIGQREIDSQIFGQIVCSTFPNEIQERVKFDHSKFAVAMVGGISWAEISALRRIPQLRQTVIMADEIMNPKVFLSNLSKIDSIN